MPLLGEAMHWTPPATLLAAALVGCGAGGGEPSPPGPDTVYVGPQVTEAVSPDIIPQIDDHEWSIEGATDDLHGRWALVGDTLEVRLNSPLYTPLAAQIVLPDTVSRSPDGDGRRWYRPVMTVQRLVPALLGGEWTADFSGPTIRIEIYAP